MQEEETKRQLFGLMCRCGRSPLFVGSVQSFADGLWSLAGGLWSFAGAWHLFAGSLWLFSSGQWSFALVCAYLWWLSVLVIALFKSTFCRIHYIEKKKG